jgi:putative sterol carrier protein
MATSQEIEQIFAKMSSVDPKKIEGMNAIIQFDLSGDNGGLYWVKIANGKVEAGTGQTENPNMTLRSAADDWAQVIAGTLNPMQAFMSGKIKIQGDMGLALKLQPLFLS